MNISQLANPLASTIKITDENLIVSLLDGREVKVPLVWFPKLFHANQEQRNNYRFIGNGVGIHWADLDEDLSIAGLLGIRER